MKTISSRKTVFFKRVFPVLWFGFLAVFLTMGVYGYMRDDDVSLFAAHADGAPPFALFLFGPLAMAVGGYAILRLFVFDLVDEVVDLGDALRVRRGGEELRIPLGEIINVDRSRFTNPPRVTLLLRQPGKLGRRIVFMPAGRVSPFREDPETLALIERIDAARR